MQNQDKVNLFWFSILSEKTFKYNATPTDNLTVYDTRSIMHYDGTLRGNFHSKTPIMVDLNTGKSIELNKKMSPIDIQKLNEMYPCKQTGPVIGEFE